MNNILKRIITYLIIFSIIFSNIYPIIAYAVMEEEVRVKVSNSPKVNILLTQNETNFDLLEFEPDLRAALEAKGLDTSNITFQAMEQTTNETASTDLNFASIVNSWETIGAPTWKATADGQIYSSVDGTSNGNWTDTNQRWSASYTGGKTGWWGTGLINQNEYETDNFEMDFNLVSAGQLNEGVCFFVTKNSDGTLNGYFFNISFHALCRSNTVYNLCLWKFANYQLDQAFTAGLNSKYWCWDATHEGQCSSSTTGGSPWVLGAETVSGNEYMKTLAKWSLPYENRQNVKYHVEAKDGHIVIQMNGATVVDLYDSTYTKGTYGFWGNNCEQTDSMYLSDFNIKTVNTTKKTYGELLNAPTWDDDAMHIIVNVDESADTSLNTPENIAKTLADKISFVQWGSAANEAGIKSFIKSNDNNGLFLSPNTYENNINDTADYIIGVIQQEYDSDYIVLGREATITVIPSKLKDGATSSIYPKGRWLIEHNHTYFDNNLGQSTEVGMYTPNLNCDFDKPGQYEIYFDDELVKTVYVHRAPIADFAIKIDGTSLELTSKSYDLDKNNNVGFGKGILKETWYYKDATAETWKKGKLIDFDNTKITLIKLEVEDYQGEKATTIKYIGQGDPVASFNLSAYTFSKYKELEINDTSYDPQGNEITGWTWNLTKEKDVIETSTEKTPSFDFKTIGTGEYKLTLSITNDKGVTSGEYARTFKVIEDTDPSTVVITPTSCLNEETQEITLEFNDSDSGFSKWRYAFTTSQTAPTEGWSEYRETTTDTITINTDGDWYLHLEALDNAGNLMQRTVGEYKIRHDYRNTYTHVLFGMQNNEGNFEDPSGYVLQEDQEDVTWGTKYVPNKRYEITIPNGCYAVQKYGTEDIEGTYTLYDFGTKVTQESKGINYELDYYPTEYTITYDLAGGKLNGSIPAKYTVLYGVTYDEPERVGYTFLGWYDQNENKVTGVNEGEDATFATVEELYQELATRQTGNIELTAKWSLDELPLEATADITANNNKGSITLDWSDYAEENAVYKTYRHLENQAAGTYEQMTYVMQPTTGKTLVDSEGKDVKAPTKPVIELTAKNVYSYSSEERGTTYKYYVESYDPDDTDNKVQTSNVAEATVTTGFKEYRYLFDDDRNTVLTATSGESTTEESITFTRELKYLHIAGVDNAGNVSETATVEIQQYQDYTVNYYLQNLDGETYTLERSVTKKAFIGTDTVSELREHEGFTTPEEQVEQVDVDVVVINYYYERNKYTIGLEKVEGVDNVTGAGTYYYGEEVTIDAEVDDGYQWINWTGSETTDEKTHTIIVPSTNLLYTANALLKTRVEVKYIDKNTGEEIAESVEYKGLYGDAYDVSEDRQEIEEYTLLEEPEYTGIMIQAEKVLTYYYAKDTEVTVKYLEQDTLDELEDTIILEGYETLPYETEEKEIEGYTLVETTGLLNGEMPRETSEVVYYYLKNTSVTVKYIDKNNGEELLEEVVYEGLYGDAYDVSGDKQEIEEYTLLEEPEHAGTMPKEPLTLVYYYAKNTEVTVKYLEQDTLDELEDLIILEGYETLPYETEEKEIPGYTLVETTGLLNGEMPREASEVVYYYLRDTSVTVKYIDKNNGEELDDSIVHEGLYGDPYDVSGDKQEIEEYTLLEEPEYTGTMPKTPITLVYYYAKTQKVTVKYLEKDSGEELADEETIIGYEGKKYAAEAKEVEGYTLVSIAGLFEGIMPRKDLTAIYYYLKNTEIEVKYVDKNTGSEISESVKYQGLYGDKYNVGKDEKIIDGYTLVETPEKIGTMEKELKTLTYYYAKNTRIIVDYIDKTTGRKLYEQAISGYEGQDYKTVAKEFEGYTLISKEGELEGTMPRETTSIKYYYLKNTEVQVKYVDKNTKETLRETVVHKGLMGDGYDVSGDKTVIPGYTLLEEPEITGIMDQARKELTYYYAKNTEIRIRYIEEHKSKDLLLMKIIAGYEGQEYNESAPEIEGYTLVTETNPIKGVLNRNIHEVDFYYLKNATVKIQYINKKTGEEIAESVMHQGLYGEYYDISEYQKEIRGYKLVETPETTGNMEEDEIVLTYYYVESKIMKIQFIDRFADINLVANGEKAKESKEEFELIKENSQEEIVKLKEGITKENTYFVDNIENKTIATLKENEVEFEDTLEEKAEEIISNDDFQITNLTDSNIKDVEKLENVVNTNTNSTTYKNEIYFMVTTGIVIGISIGMWMFFTN